MDLWVDDAKPAPEGVAVARTYDDALSMLRRFEYGTLYLDHDLGETRTGYDLLMLRCTRRDPATAPRRRSHGTQRAGRASSPPRSRWGWRPLALPLPFKRAPNGVYEAETSG